MDAEGTRLHRAGLVVCILLLATGMVLPQAVAGSSLLQSPDSGPNRRATSPPRRRWWAT